MYTMTEKEMATDSIFAEKICGTEYYRFATECSNKNLCADLINLSKETAEFCCKMSDLMTSRSWITVDEAEFSELNKLRRHFSN